MTGSILPSSVFHGSNGGTNFQPIQTFGNTGNTGIVTEAALRRDYSITAGIAIWRGFGIHAGYYNKRDQFTGSLAQVQPGGSLTSSDQTTRIIDGPIIGLFGNTELTERVNMYGNLSYAILNWSTGPPGSFTCLATFGCQTNQHAYGYSGEFGAHIIGPAIWKITPELQIGYRFQVIQANLDPLQFGGQAITGSTTVNDLTHGPIFTVSARF